MKGGHQIKMSRLFFHTREKITFVQAFLKYSSTSFPKQPQPAIRRSIQITRANTDPLQDSFKSIEIPCVK